MFSAARPAAACPNGIVLAPTALRHAPEKLLLRHNPVSPFAPILKIVRIVGWLTRRLICSGKSKTPRNCSRNGNRYATPKFQGCF